ncbi:MAG: flagellar motor protein MotA [Alphaproteobacteria bacterium]
MSRPNSFLIRMFLFLAIVAVCAFMVIEPLVEAFFSNVFINGIILGALLVGIGITFWMVAKLNREISWVESFKLGAHGAQTSLATPRLLASAATMLTERTDRSRSLSLSTTAMQTLLDGVAARLDEAREVSRYMIGLLVFLGLLGTFWGLLDTVQSVAGVIAGVQVGGSDAAGAFADLKAGLDAPLAGMGTAFSSSLFGLAGSLILGFLSLQAGQAQNRFYNDLEEWLSGLTRLSGGGGPIGDGEQSVPAYIQALLEQTADSLEGLQRTIAKAEESRAASHNDINDLTDKLGTLADTMRTEQDLMLRLAEGQQKLQQVLENTATGGSADHARLKNIDQHLNRMLERMETGRAETVQEIRSEIRLLARTIAAIAEGGEV